MSIFLTYNEPVYQRARQLSPSEKGLVNNQIQEWMNKGIVQPSPSEYARLVVLVRKKNGFFHIQVDESSRKYTAFIVPDEHYRF